MISLIHFLFATPPYCRRSPPSTLTPPPPVPKLSSRTRRKQSVENIFFIYLSLFPRKKKDFLLVCADGRERKIADDVRISLEKAFITYPGVWFLARFSRRAKFSSLFARLGKLLRTERSFVLKNRCKQCIHSEAWLNVTLVVRVDDDAMSSDSVGRRIGREKSGVE